ncbi:MAG TPA: DUF1318 domain-containing protein [Spirochaetota bacterium]|nr:DUF1318 domain-containing protein [Spirochaetota bacterium]
MKKNVVAIALACIAGIVVCMSGCTSSGCIQDMPSCLEIYPPAINITGEKTALERQLIGEYHELEQDAWVTSTVMTPSKGNRKAVINADGELLNAIQIRELNSDIIRLYKDKGLIGEQNNGYIAIVDEKKLQSLQSLQESDAIRTIVQQENNARSIIFVKSSGATKSNETKAIQFAVEFAKEQHAKAKKGDWIQNNDGRWVKK